MVKISFRIYVLCFRAWLMEPWLCAGVDGFFLTTEDTESTERG